MTLEDSIDELRGEISDILDDLISGRPTPPLGRSIFGLHRRLDRLADLLESRPTRLIDIAELRDFGSVGRSG